MQCAKEKCFPEFHSFLFGIVRVFHHFSDVCFGLCILMVFTVLTSTVRKGGRERSFSFLCIWDMLLSGDLLEVTSRIEPIYFFSVASEALI